MASLSRPLKYAGLCVALLLLVLQGVRPEDAPKKEGPKVDLKTVYVAEIINEGASTAADYGNDSKLRRRLGPKTLMPIGYRQHFTLGQ